MERCHQNNIEPNAARLQPMLEELKFMGAIISNQGMKPVPDKVAAITQMLPPEKKAALLRFIGMVNYLAPFCANIPELGDTTSANAHPGCCTFHLVGSSG